MTQQDKFPLRALLPLLCITGLAAAGWMTSMSFLSSLLASQFEAGIWSAALIMIAVHTGSFTLGGWVSLRVVNRWGSKASYVTGIAILGLYLAFLGATENLLVGVPLGLLAGFGLAMHWTGLQNYTLEIAPPKHRGMISGSVSFVIVGSVGVSGLVLGIVTGDGGLVRFVSIAASMVGLAFVLALLFLPRTERKIPRSSSGSVFAALKDTNLRRMAYVRSAHASAFVLFNLMAGPRLVEVGGGLEYVGYLAFAGSISGGVAQLLVGYLSDLLGRTGLLYLLLAISITACLSFIMADSVYLLLLITSLHWFSQFAFQTVLVPLGGDLSPPGQTADAMALLTIAYSFGLVAGGTYVGLLSFSPWPDAGFVITAILLALAIPSVFRLRSRLESLAAAAA